MRVAFFDLDHTLVEGDCDVLWMQHLASSGRGDLEPMRRFMAAYEAGTLEIEAYYAYSLAVFRGHTAADFEAELEAFYRAEVEPRLRPWVLERLAAEREAGALCVLVTATGELVARPVVRALGLDALLATRLEHRAGHLTGSILGQACFREGKLTQIESWLRGRGTSLDALDDSAYYGDSRNDRFVMQRVQRPVAVGPDSHLRALAEERGWELLGAAPIK